jgi:raffinose/stachyose/melibiose transport system permease protein
MKKKMLQSRDVLKPGSAIIFFLLAPPVVIYLMSTIVPLVMAGYISLFNWGGGRNNIFIGLRNYRDVFRDMNFWRDAWQTLVITLFNLAGQVGIAFVVSFLLFSNMTRFKGFHRRVVFFPVILSSLVVGIVWKIIYNSRYGPLNTVLQAIGLEGLIIRWLADSRFNLFFVSVPVIWEFIGLYALMLMGVLSNVPQDLFEVAELDGATGIKKAIYVIIPAIYKTVAVCITICFAGTLRIFDQIVSMTNGGPGSSTMTMTIYAYQVAFNFYKLGYGSAISIIIIAMIAIATVGVNRLLKGDRFE